MRKQTAWLVSAIIVLLGFTGCNALFGSSSSPPSYITWEVRAVGSPTTTHLVFEFSHDPPSDLVALDFGLQGHQPWSGAVMGAATIGELSGTGTTRTLTLSNVTAGTVLVGISRPRVSEETHSVTLHGPPPPITWTATPVGTPVTTAINVTFSRPLLTPLPSATDFTITPGTGSATIGSLTIPPGPLSSTVTLTLSNVTAGTVEISIDRAGFCSEPRTVTLSTTTWTATSVGLAIDFTFDYEVSPWLSATDFTITPGTGAATVGTLTGMGATRTLTLSNVTAGTVEISIDWAGICSEPRTVTLSLITWTAVAVGAPTTTGIEFTFNHSPPPLSAADFTITAGSGSAIVGSLTGTETTRTLTLSNVTAGTVGISIVRDGVAGGPQTLTLVSAAPVLVPTGVTLAEQLSWIRGFGQAGNHYIVELSGNETINAAAAAMPSGNNVTITIRGTSLSEITGTFTVPSGVTLILDNNITITGSDTRGVTVNTGGTLVMNAGARIAGNSISASEGGLNSVFSQGGGVLISSGAVFIMNGGEISGNTLSANSSGWGSSSPPTANAQGGGVAVWGTFTMNGGEISGNTVTANRSGSAGFSFSEGGAVFVGAGGTFTMTGGVLSGNTVTSTGNSPVSRGGGVHVAHSSGFGANLVPAGVFRISNGTIHGSETAVPVTQRNTSGNGASCSLSNAGTAERGTFVGGNFSSLGTLGTTLLTVNILNGNLQW